jgi:dihydroxy-acid dehydratase
VCDGDMIEIDISARRLELLISKDELDRRLSHWQPREPRVKRGQLTLWERFALPNSKGGGLPLNI